jgi:hypothetical protein
MPPAAIDTSRPCSTSIEPCRASSVVCAAPDRDLADRLFHNGIPFYAVRNAFILAATRRIRNNAFAALLPPVRSLHYFLPVLREVIERPPGYREIEEMLQLLSRDRSSP